MKLLKKILVIFLVICLAAPSVGCTKNSSNAPSSTIPESNDYLIINGSCDYKIVVPDNPRDYERHASNELMDNFYLATGIKLSIFNESQVTYSKDSKLLIIGETKISKQNNISADKSKFGARGFVLKKVDTNVFFLGGDTSGTLYSVYEFLHHTFNYEPYAIDEISLDVEVAEKKLKDFNIEEIPDIPYTLGIGKFFREGYVLDGHRMRYNIFNEVFIPATSQPWHNSFEYFNPNEYNNKNRPSTYHPKWFTDEGTQLHYTAHGDAEELKAMQNLLYEKMVKAIEESFKKGKYYEYIGFSLQDTTAWALDKSVNADKEKYGSAYATAQVIKFLNPIAKRIKEYMSSEWDGRKMSITITGYYAMENPPVVEKNGKYVPIDDAVTPEDNISVLLAPISNSYNGSYEEANVDGKIKQWKGLVDDVLLWFYGFYHTGALVYFDNVYSLQDLFRGAKNNDAAYMFLESGIDSYAITPFGALRQYLISKLTWDTEQDVDLLISDFFKNYYKDASDVMWKYFEELVSLSAINKMNGFSGVCAFQGWENKSYWPLNTLLGFKNYFEQAFDAIEGLKEMNSTTYNKLYNRLISESIMYRYFLLKLYAVEAFEDDESFYKEVESFKSDCNSLGVNSYSAYAPNISDLVFTREA